MNPFFSITLFQQTQWLAQKITPRAHIRSAVRRLMTSNPSTPGIWMSRKITSGAEVSSAVDFRAVATFAGNRELRKICQQLPHASARGGFIVGNQRCPFSLSPRASRNTMASTCETTKKHKDP
jgi:hypothetical protein